MLVESPRGIFTWDGQSLTPAGAVAAVHEAAATPDAQAEPDRDALARDAGAATRALGRRAVWPWQPYAVQTSALGVVTLHEALERLAFTSVWLDDDVSGLALQLGAAHDVFVAPSRPQVAAWLAELSRERQLALNLIPTAGAVSLALVHVAAPRVARAKLHEAKVRCAPGGHVACVTRAGAEAATLHAAGALGLVLDHQWLDFVPEVLPGPLYTDNAAGLLVFHLDAAAHQGEVDVAPPELDWPYGFFDVHQLSAERRGVAGLEQLAAVLSQLAPHGVAHQRLQPSGEGDVLTWYDGRGVGFVATAHADGQMFFDLVPYDRELEHALCMAAALVFAGPHTRLRYRVPPADGGARLVREALEASP